MKELKRTFLRGWQVALLGLLLPLISFSQDVNLDPVTSTYALKNVNIIQAPGRKIDLGTVVIKDGVIQSVGKNVTIPVDAQIINADSMYLYAGFIDGLSHVGIPKPKEQERPRVKDPGNPPNDVAGITPHRDVRSTLDPKDKSLESMRKLGFTAAHVVPYGRMLPGKGALIILSGSSADDLVLKDNTSMFSKLQGAQRMYPNTVIGVMAKFRELYRQADQAKLYNAKYAAGASGMERPNSDRVLEAFYPVINKRIPVAFKAESVLDVQRVLALKKDLGFNLMLGEVKQGWDIADQIKSAQASVFLSLDLPELKEEEPDSTKEEKKNKTEFDLEQERLEKRKMDMILKYYQQPALYKSKGISFGFSTLEAKSKDIHSTLVKMVSKGLSADDALAALTTTPASLLGVSNVMGTVDPGKMANLVITDKPYFEDKSNVKYVFIDGKMHTYDAKPVKKKKDGEEDVNAAGEWNYTTESPQGTSTGVMKITGEDGDYSGTITTSFSPDGSEMQGITVSGNRITFAFQINAGGSSLTIEVDAEIDGNQLDGTMTAGQFGSFPLEAEKKPER